MTSTDDSETDDVEQSRSRHLLAVRGVAKSYGPVVALRSVDLTVEPGEIHALLGANGAGKSTLVKILSGVLAPDRGTVEVSGNAVALRSPADARAAGLAPVFQDPSLVPDLTVAENLRLTGTDAGTVRRRLDELDLPVDLGALVSEVPLPMLRMIDLARALAHDPALLLLDEITAALPSDYAEKVVEVVREHREAGRSVLFISHRLAEVRQLCDRATVLRDGHDVDTHRMAEGSEERIVAAMLGERAAAASARAAATDTVSPTDGRPAEPVLEAVGLSDGHTLRDVSFAVGRGEVLGMVALEGQGQDSLFEILSGDRKPVSGELRHEGRVVHARHPGDAVGRGIVLVPADRGEALLPQRSVLENLTAPLYARTARWGLIRSGRERSRVARVVNRLEIDIRAQDQVQRLSGGNRQKVTIGRWLASEFTSLLCFDPTRGIDVGTKHQIYDLIRDLARQGKSVLMFTSELREVPLVCDRVVVLYDGRIVAEMPAADADEATLLGAAHGLTPSMESS
jgi:ribose transport system ATP-binding protein